MNIVRIAADLITPWVAMETLGLTAQAGQPLTAETLRDAYAPLILAAHPDKNPGKETESHERMVIINAAKDILKRFIGTSLPMKPEETAIPAPTTESEGFDQWYTDFLNSNNLVVGQQDLPKNAMRVTEAQVLEWLKQVLASGMHQAFIREPYQGFEIMNRIGLSPYGSKGRTQRVPPDFQPEKLLESIKQVINRASPNSFPQTIIDMQLKPEYHVPEAWITFMDNNGERGAWHQKYRSISFERPVKKAKKPEGVGMTREGIEAQLRTEGLKIVGGGDKYAYWGLEKGNQYCIREAAKTLRIMKKWKDGTWLGITNEYYFGSLTPQMVINMSNLIKRKNSVIEPTANTKSVTKQAVDQDSQEWQGQQILRWKVTAMDGKVYYAWATTKEAAQKKSEKFVTVKSVEPAGPLLTGKSRGFNLKRFSSKTTNAVANAVNRTAMFIKPPGVTVEVAMAIYRCMHNQATIEDWEMMDTTPGALDMVRRVLEANNTQDIGAEMKWWETQLAIARN